MTSTHCSVLAVACSLIGCGGGNTASPPVVTTCPGQTEVTVAQPAATITEVAVAGATVAASQQPQRFTLNDTELRAIHSDLTGKDHQLIIGLPPSFAKEPIRRYPVLYLLDGQWDFALLAMLSGGLRYDQVLPEMLIVGLSYAGQQPDYEALRADDYAPTRAKNHEGKVMGGGATKFLEFLERTVIPLAETDYRGDPTKRVLSGSSFGGLFTLHALFEKPELFQTYLVISPAVGWDDGYIAKRERAFKQVRSSLDRRIWLSIGDSEWPKYVEEAKAFFRQFEASRYRGVTVKLYTVPGERHAGVKPEAYNRAMRFAAEPWL